MVPYGIPFWVTIPNITIQPIWNPQVLMAKSPKHPRIPWNLVVGSFWWSRYSTISNPRPTMLFGINHGKGLRLAPYLRHPGPPLLGQLPQLPALQSAAVPTAARPGSPAPSLAKLLVQNIQGIPGVVKGNQKENLDHMIDLYVLSVFCLFIYLLT